MFKWCMIFIPFAFSSLHPVNWHTIESNKLEYSTFDTSLQNASIISISPDNAFIIVASSSAKGTIKLYDAYALKFIGAVTTDNLIKQVLITPNSRTLIVVFHLGVVQLWAKDNVTDVSFTTMKHNHSINSIAISSDSKYMASCCRNFLYLLNIPENESLGNSSIEGSVSAVAFDPQGSFLATGLENGDIITWILNKESINIDYRFVGHSTVVLAVKVSSNGKTMVSSSRDTTVKVWDIASKKLVHTLPHTTPIDLVCLSEDNAYILTGNAITDIRYGCGEKKIRVWSTQTGQHVHTLIGHTGTIQSLEVKNNVVLTLAPTDGTARLWDLLTGRCLHTLSLPNNTALLSINMNSTNDSLIAVAGDNKVHIWKLPKKPLFCTTLTAARLTDIVFLFCKQKI